jgi:hypothetical protein
MFPWKDFLLGRIREIQKHKEERGRSGEFKKTRRKEWRKEKEEIFMYVEVPILVCFPSVGNTLGVPPSCNLPQENPLIWEPPLQQNSLSTQRSKLECVEGRLLFATACPN